MEEHAEEDGEGGEVGKAGGQERPEVVARQNEGDRRHEHGAELERPQSDPTADQSHEHRSDREEEADLQRQQRRDAVVLARVVSVEYNDAEEQIRQREVGPDDVVGGGREDRQQNHDREAREDVGKHDYYYI